jgi:hypothetical protein
MDLSQEKLLSIGIVILLSVSGLATIIYYNDGALDSNSSNQAGWIDPITEVENCENCTGPDESHQHTNIMQHFLQTKNITLIDYHNLNCDGNVKPPAELDNTAGRPCKAEYKNVAPTPGDNSEIAIEGNFLEDCDNSDGKGGCYAYV